MTARSAVEAFACVAEGLVCEEDLNEILLRLVDDVRALLGCDAVGVLLSTGPEEIELLAASSHAASELEMYQAQTHTGPCIDVIRSGQALAVSGQEAMVERWDSVGTQLAGMGVSVVHAYPLRWHGRVLGGLNLFWSEGSEPTGEPGLGQTFADLVTVLVMRSIGLTEDETARRLQDAVAGRAVIEQAKGVLGYRRGLAMQAAYDELVRLGREDRQPITEVARRIVTAARGGDDDAV
jgi:transcriptional regulator with GAF, ATPase, and Fis domain